MPRQEPPPHAAIPSESHCDEPPWVRELCPPPEPVRAFQACSGRAHVAFLDSALVHPELGRYSFLAADPFAWFELPVEGPDAWDLLRSELAPYATARRQELPPFQGGAVAVLGYELGQQIEQLPPPRRDEFRFPGAAFGLYDLVLAWDHRAGRAWLISQGFPERDTAARRRRAALRGQAMLGWLHEAASADGALPQRPAEGRRALARHNLVEQWPVPGTTLTSNFSAKAFQTAVARVIEYIRAGDVFQVNLAQRLLQPASDDPRALYLRLRARNPATFAAYFDLGCCQLLSASPERFLRAVDGQVETRPIKGTRRRAGWPEADLFSGDELQASPKDLAENVMIVDLLRNDLSRVCLADSVRVNQLCHVERYQFVTHLVSAVAGQLAPGQDALSLWRAAFPGGSITGAPKVRAMQIIAELEPTARGAYCGSLGYVGFDGTLDSNLLIRTITAGAGFWQAPVGGGVVVGSDPRQEYEETWHKAAGLLRAMER